MTFESLSFSELGESVFCVYLSSSQERAEAGLGSDFLQVQSTAAFIGYEWSSTPEEQGGWWPRGQGVEKCLSLKHHI